MPHVRVRVRAHEEGEDKEEDEEKEDNEQDVMRRMRTKRRKMMMLRFKRNLMTIRVIMMTTLRHDFNSIMMMIVAFCILSIGDSDSISQNVPASLIKGGPVYRGRNLRLVHS